MRITFSCSLSDFKNFSVQYDDRRVRADSDKLWWSSIRRNDRKSLDPFFRALRLCEYWLFCRRNECVTVPHLQTPQLSGQFYYIYLNISRLGIPHELQRAAIFFCPGSGWARYCCRSPVSGLFLWRTGIRRCICVFSTTNGWNHRCGGLWRRL